jgi:hypothetical protein
MQYSEIVLKEFELLDPKYKLRLCGLAVRVPGYRFRDSWRFQIV